MSGITHMLPHYYETNFNGSSSLRFKTFKDLRKIHQIPARQTQVPNQTHTQLSALICYDCFAKFNCE